MADLKNITFSSDRKDEWIKAIAKTIQLLSIYYGLFLVVVGCVCNPLSFIVLSRKSFRSSNLSFHLRILSASDLANLLNMFFNIFLQRAYDVDFNASQAGCQVSVFCGHLSLLLSSWILVIVTTERALCIHRPHRYPIMCSQAVGKAVLATTVVIFSLISLLPTLTYEDVVVTHPLTNTTTLLRCQTVNHGNSVGQSILIVLLFALLPSLLLVVLNIFIIVGVVKSRKSVMKQPNTTVDRSNKETTGTVTSAQWRTYQRHGQHSIFRREASLTKTVLAVNITFILCNFPVCAFGASLRIMQGDMGVLGLAIFDLMLMFVYTNNAMNFVLYCVTGSKFRSELKAVFKDITQCCCPK